MVTPELIKYVTEQLAAGLTPVQISALLKQNGWLGTDIAEVLGTNSPTVSALSTSTPPSITQSSLIPPTIVTPQKKRGTNHVITFILILAILAGVAFLLWYEGLIPFFQVENAINLL